MKRRDFMAGALASVLSGHSAHAARLPGHSAPLQTVRAFQSLPAITEPGSGGTIHILFSSWCVNSQRLYRESRAIVGRASLRWVPASGGLPEGSEAVERLLENPDPAKLAAAFDPLPVNEIRQNTPLADGQDQRLVSSLFPILIRDTGISPTTPTVAYEYGSGRGMLAVGAMPAEALMTIAGVAS